MRGWRFGLQLSAFACPVRLLLFASTSFELFFLLAGVIEEKCGNERKHQDCNGR